MVSPTRRRDAVCYLQRRHRVSERRACLEGCIYFDRWPHQRVSPSRLVGERGGHGVQCGPTMFTKQMSRPVESLDPPSWPPEAEQIERTRRKTWSRARSEVFVPYGPPEMSDTAADRRRVAGCGIVTLVRRLRATECSERALRAPRASRRSTPRRPGRPSSSRSPGFD